jgi:hypothetical protein
MERVALGVGARELRRSTGVDSAEHMVVGEEVVKAQVLNRSTDQSDSARVSSKLDLRVDHANLHARPQSATGQISPCLALTT